MSNSPNFCSIIRGIIFSAVVKHGSTMIPRTSDLAALAIQQLMDRDVGGRPMLVKDGFWVSGYPADQPNYNSGYHHYIGSLVIHFDMIYSLIAVFQSSTR